MALFDNDKSAEETQEPLLYDYGNVEEVDGTIGYKSVNRYGQKYLILLDLLYLSQASVKSCLQINYKGDKTALHEAQNQSSIAFNTFTGVGFTSPHYGFNSEQEISQTIEAGKKENHIAATVHSILHGKFPDNEVKINKNGPRIALLEQVAEEEADDESVHYNTIRAIEKIKEELPILYENDNLVNEVIEAIDSNNQVEIDEKIKEIIGIMTQKITNTKKKIRNTELEIENIRFQNGQVFGSEYSEYVSKITVGGIKLERIHIERQDNFFNTDTEKTEKISDLEKKIYYFLEGSKRYYFNKNTGFLYETPDKDIDMLKPSDRVRVFDGKRWFNKSDNAICTQTPLYIEHKMSERHLFYFSYYDESKGSYVYSNPLTDKIIEAQVNKPEKNFNLPDKEKKTISNYFINKKLESTISSLRKNSKIEDDVEFYKDFCPSVLPEYNLINSTGYNNDIDNFEEILNYGYKNPISPSCFSKLSEDDFTGIKGGRSIEDAIKDIENLEEDASDAQVKSIADCNFAPVASCFGSATIVANTLREKTLFFLKSVLRSREYKPKKIVTTKYKDGNLIEKETGFCESSFRPKDYIENNVGVSFQTITEERNANSMSNDLTKGPDVTLCYNICRENNCAKKYDIDLLAETYNRKDRLEAAKEYIKNNPETVEDINKKKQNTKKQLEIMKKNEEQENTRATNLLIKALNELSLISRISFIDKIIKYFYKFFADKKYNTEDEKIYNKSVSTIKRLSSDHSFDKKIIETTRNRLFEASKKLEKKKLPVINFTVKTNLKNAQKENKNRTF